MSNPLAAVSTAIPQETYPLSVEMVKEPQPTVGQATFDVRQSTEDIQSGKKPIDVYNAGVKRKYGIEGAPKYLRNLAGVDFAASVVTKTAVRKGLVFNDGMKKRLMFIANDGGVVLRKRSQLATMVRNRVLSAMPKESALERGGAEMLFPPGAGRDKTYGTGNLGRSYNPVYGSTSTYESMLEATNTGFMAAAGNYHFMGRLVAGMPKKRELVNTKVAVTRDEAIKAHIHCGFLHSPSAVQPEEHWHNALTVWRRIAPWDDMKNAFSRLSLNAEVGADGVLNTANAIKINLKADLGVPYCAKGSNADALAAAFAVARSIDQDPEYQKDPAAYYRRDFNRAPWRVTTMGKTKSDIYKLKKLQNANMRFVNVLPAHLKMMVARSTQRYDDAKISLVKQSAFWCNHVGISTGPENLEYLREGFACMAIGRQHYQHMLTQEGPHRAKMFRHADYFDNWPGMNLPDKEIEEAYLATNGLLRTAQKVGMTQETPGLILNALDVQMRSARIGWIHCGDDTILCFRTVGFRTVNVAHQFEPVRLVEQAYFRIYAITTDFESFDLTQDLDVLAENINVTADAMSRINANDAMLWKAIINKRKVLLVDGGVVDMENGGASGVNLQSSLNDMHTDVFCQRFERALLKKCKVGRLGKDAATGAIIQLPGNVVVPPPLQEDATSVDVNHRSDSVDAFYHPDPLSKTDIEHLAQTVASSLGFRVTLGSFACCDNELITSDTYTPDDARFFDGPYKWNHPITTWLSLEKLSVPFLGMEIQASRPLFTERPFARELCAMYTELGYPRPVLDNNGNDISPHRRVIRHARAHYTSIYLDQRMLRTPGAYTLPSQAIYAAKDRTIYRHPNDGGEDIDHSYVDGDGDQIRYYVMKDAEDVRPLEECTTPGMNMVGMNTIGIAQVQLDRAVKNLMYSGKMWIKNKDEHAMHDCIRLLSMLGNWGCLFIMDTQAMQLWEKMVSQTQNYWASYNTVHPDVFAAGHDNPASHFHPTNILEHRQYGPWPVGAVPYDALQYCHVTQNMDVEIARFDAVNWCVLRMAENSLPSAKTPIAGMRQLAQNLGEMYDFFASDPESTEKNPIAQAMLGYFQEEEEENLGGMTTAIGYPEDFETACRHLPRAVILALFFPSGLQHNHRASGVHARSGETPVFPPRTAAPAVVSGIIRGYEDVPMSMRKTPPYVKKVTQQVIRSRFNHTDAEYIIGRLEDREKTERHLHWFLRSYYTRYRVAVYEFYHIVEKVWGKPCMDTISRKMALKERKKHQWAAYRRFLGEKFGRDPPAKPFQGMYPQEARDADQRSCNDGYHGMNYRITVQVNPTTTVEVDGRGQSVRKFLPDGRWHAEFYYSNLIVYVNHEGQRAVPRNDVPALDAVVDDWQRDEDGVITGPPAPYGGDTYTEHPSWGPRNLVNMVQRVWLSDVSLTTLFADNTHGLLARRKVREYIQANSANDSLRVGDFYITLAQLDIIERFAGSSHLIANKLKANELASDPLYGSDFAVNTQAKIDAMTVVAVVPDDSTLDPMSQQTSDWADMMEEEDEREFDQQGNRIITAEYLWKNVSAQVEERRIAEGDRDVSNVRSLQELALNAIAGEMFTTGTLSGGLLPVYAPPLYEGDPIEDEMQQMLNHPDFPDISGLTLERPPKKPRGVVRLDTPPGQVRIAPGPGQHAFTVDHVENVRMPRVAIGDARMQNLRATAEKHFGRPPPNVEVRNSTAVAIAEAGAARRAPTADEAPEQPKLTKTQKRRQQRSNAKAAKGGYVRGFDYHEQDFTQQDEENAARDEAENNLAQGRAAERAYRLEGGN